jgi:hypothetical protein
MSMYSSLGWAREREQGRHEGNQGHDGVGFSKLILSKGLVELGCVATFAGLTLGKGARGNLLASEFIVSEQGGFNAINRSLRCGVARTRFLGGVRAANA